MNVKAIVAQDGILVQPHLGEDLLGGVGNRPDLQVTIPGQRDEHAIGQGDKVHTCGCDIETGGHQLSGERLVEPEGHFVVLPGLGGTHQDQHPVLVLGVEDLVALQLRERQGGTGARLEGDVGMGDPQDVREDETPVDGR